MLWDYRGHKRRDSEKLTSKPDVWGIGQMMWNLVINLPGKKGYFQEPFFDRDGTQGRQLVDGMPYSQRDPDGLFSGSVPFEASSSYTAMLHNTVKRCLRYQQSERPSVQDPKAITSKYAHGKEDPGSFVGGDVAIKIPGEIERFSTGRALFPTSTPRNGSKRKRRQPEK
jgi:hypothetical protein